MSAEARFEVRVECMECGALWFIDVTRDSAYEVEGQIEDHEHIDPPTEEERDGPLASP